MKTFLLLALAATLGLSASAQQGHHSRPNQVNHATQNNRYDQRVSAINHDYDNRINGLRTQSFRRAKQRQQQINELNRQRAIALQQCHDQYSAPYASAYPVPQHRAGASVTLHIGF